MSELVLQNIFDFKCIIKNIDVRLNCRIENGIKQLLAIVTNDGDIIIHYTYGELPAVLKRIPWFSECCKTIQAICFDPTATWLLVVCADNSLYIIPALSLVDKKQKIDCKWSVNDLTHFPKHPQAPDSKPLCAVWWQTLECNQNALLGHENGSIGLISLTDGRCLGYCTINEPVEQLFLCQDNSLDTVAVLINAASGQQYRLILEQPSIGYLWPPEAYNLNDENSRSRLYNLRQLGVDKFFSFKQRFDALGGRRDSQASDTTTDSSHSENSTNSVPELLPRLCDTYFAPQYARNRYLFSAFYKPTALLTVHASDVESAPLYIHKLPLKTNNLLLTDRLIYTTNEDQNVISVVSSQLSECALEGDSGFNLNSLIAQFEVQNESEKILNVYKLTDVTIIKDRRSKEEVKRERDNKLYTLPKNVNELNVRKTKIDTCVIVTTNSVYKILIGCSPINKFIQLINEDWNVELAEYLAIIFGLNIQQLMECCGDLLIANGAFHQGLILYKQAKVHLLKRVLKLAVSADCKALLKFVNLCLSASKIEMSMATKIHIGNLAVMAYTELVLRHGGPARIMNNREFMNFLYYEEYYDQVLAVNVACRASHWNVVALLAKSRGLQAEVVEALSLILQSSKLQLHEDYHFLIALSEPSLTQGLLTNAPAGAVIFSYIRGNAQHFPIDVLRRLAMQYDPSQPSALPLTSKLFLRTKQSSSTDSTLDSLDLEGCPQTAVIVKEFVETFVFVLIALVAKTNNDCYDVGLLEKVEVPDVLDDFTPIEKLPDLRPISCGYEHTAIVRNNCVFTMGVTTSGCLGLGPFLSQSSPPRLVQMLADLKVRVLSVSCGRKHTLALTDFGIYAWGSNSHGQLGLGPFVRDSPYPQVISALAGTCIIDVVAGQYHTLALTSTGKVYTWGWGIHGQLGHSSCNNEFYPKLLEFEDVVVQIAGGHAHSLLLTREGKVYGFGSNVFGQLECGNAEGCSKITRPTWVVVMPDMYKPVNKVATSYFHNICVVSNQLVYTWGANPQEVRLMLTKYSQKKFGSNGKPYEPWKSSCNIYTSATNKKIEQVATGFRHSVVLHNGKLMWNKVKEGEMSSPKLRDEDVLSLGQRFLHVSCGLDYVMALDVSGKVLAWGNNTMAQTLLGRSYEDAVRQDGKMILFRNTKRVLKVPQQNQANGEIYPIEVPGLPTMAITYNPLDHRHLFDRRIPPYRIFNIENNFHQDTETTSKPVMRNSLNFNYLQESPNFTLGPKTLHYVLETYFGHYDSENVLSKCLELDSYQAASKIALLDGHFSDSLGFQLIAFKRYMDKFSLDLSTIKRKDNFEKNEEDKKIDSNKTDVEYKLELNIMNSPAHIQNMLSTSSSLDSIRQWDDLEHQGGCESPCEISDFGEVRQSVSHYVQSLKTDSPPITSVSNLISGNDLKPQYKLDEDLNIKDKDTIEIINTASELIEFYIKKTYVSENHILMQNILLKCIEFWLSTNLPVIVLERVLLKNMDKYFYPLSILLFCKNFNNNLDDEISKDDDVKRHKSAGFLKEFSTKFCLQLCSMVLENANKA